MAKEQENILNDEEFKLYVHFISRMLWGLRASQALAILRETETEVLFSSKVGIGDPSLPTTSKVEASALTSQ